MEDDLPYPAWIEPQLQEMRPAFRGPDGSLPSLGEVWRRLLASELESHGIEPTEENLAAWNESSSWRLTAAAKAAE